MMLLVVAAVWFACSIPVSLLLARVVRTPGTPELFGMDDADVLYRYPDGSIERVALLQPATELS